jgi:hypothetical protein
MISSGRAIFKVEGYIIVDELAQDSDPFEEEEQILKRLEDTPDGFFGSVSYQPDLELKIIDNAVKSKKK